jgi:hypothetical protein
LIHGRSLRLTVNDPGAIPLLLAALSGSDCVAEQIGPRSLHVWPQWLVSAADAVQAPIELRFFARAWEAAHPGVLIALLVV